MPDNIGHVGNWEDLDQFAGWVFSSHGPGFMAAVPFVDPCHFRKLAIAVTLGRWGGFQAEMLVVQPDVRIRWHVPEGAEHRLVFLGGEVTVVSGHTTLSTVPAREEMLGKIREAQKSGDSDTHLREMTHPNRSTSFTLAHKDHATLHCHVGGCVIVVLQRYDSGVYGSCLEGLRLETPSSQSS